MAFSTSTLKQQYVYGLTAGGNPSNEVRNYPESSEEEGQSGARGADYSHAHKRCREVHRTAMSRSRRKCAIFRVLLVRRLNEQLEPKGVHIPPSTSQHSDGNGTHATALKPHGNRGQSARRIQDQNPDRRRSP